MFGLMVGASLRVGEVSTLQLGDIEESISPCSLVKLRVHGKGNKERVVWLTPSLSDDSPASPAARARGKMQKAASRMWKNRNDCQF